MAGKAFKNNDVMRHNTRNRPHEGKTASARCSLQHCSRLTAHYSLLTTANIFTAQRSPLTAHCSHYTHILTAHRVLFSLPASCFLPTAHCSLLPTSSLLLMHCSLITALTTLTTLSADCSLLNAHSSTILLSSLSPFYSTSLFQPFLCIIF